MKINKIFDHLDNICLLKLFYVFKFTQVDITEPKASATSTERLHFAGVSTQNQTKLGRLARNRNVTEVNFNDGSKYVGDIENGMKEGLGILFAPDGAIYLGQWLQDTYHGQGVYIHPDGQRYQGDLQQGEKIGQGKMHYLNGDFYNGEWDINIKQGNGQQIYANGDRYQGEWRNGERWGEGTLYSSGQMVAEGQWIQDRFISGKVKNKYYQGGWSNNAFNGVGTYRFADGSVYEGDWKNNQKNGSGTYHYLNGDIYQGEFYNGFKHGKGVYKYASGDIYEGDYLFDSKHGYGCMKFISGDVYLGYWQRDSFSGRGRYTFHQRDFLNGEFKHGKLMSNAEKVREEKIDNSRQKKQNWTNSYVSSPIQLVQVEKTTKLSQSPSPTKSKTLVSRTSRRRLQYS